MFFYSEQDQQQVPSIVTDGLVLHLDAGDTNSYPGTGTTWYDLSGNGNNGTLVNDVGYNSDNGGSLSFDGVDDYVINSSTTDIPIGNSNRTVQIWTYPRGDTNNFIQLGTRVGGQGYIVEFYKINSSVFLFTDGINVENNLTISGSQLPILNTWNHIIFGNLGQSWFYYLNGVLQASGTWSIPLNIVGQKYIIGKRDDAPQNNSNANISQVSVYNRALSQEEITQNFNATKSRFGL